MSISKPSNNHSNSSNSGLDETNIFENFVPSKIFDISRTDKYPLVQPELNRIIADLTNFTTLNYTTNIATIMSVLRNREIVEYQQFLMEAAIHNISEDTVDIDFIRIGLNLSITDIEKLLDGENGLIRVRTQNRQDRLTVKKLNVGNENTGFKKSDNKPFFTQRFQLVADHDEYRYINIYIAEPYHDRNKGRTLKYTCEIEYIPTRVSRHLASFMLYQLQSVLEIRRYKQLIDNALLLELHTGYIMDGVSQLFGFLLSKNNSVKAGQVYPMEEDMVAETVYVGSRGNDHLIGYDKVLKENKKFVEEVALGWELVANRLDGIKDWFPDQVCSFRLESRRRFENEPVKLIDISIVESLLRNVKLLKPKYLAELTDVELQSLLMDKSIKPLKKLWRAVFIRCRGKFVYFRVDDNQVDKAFRGCGKRLLEAINNPIKELTEVKGNYTKAVTDVREIVEPLIEEVASKSHKLPNIIKAKERAIYVGDYKIFCVSGCLS